MTKQEAIDFLMERHKRQILAAQVIKNQTDFSPVEQAKYKVRCELARQYKEIADMLAADIDDRK